MKVSVISAIVLALCVSVARCENESNDKIKKYILILYLRSILESKPTTSSYQPQSKPLSVLMPEQTAPKHDPMIVTWTDNDATGSKYGFIARPSTEISTSPMSVVNSVTRTSFMPPYAERTCIKPDFKGELVENWPLAGVDRGRPIFQIFIKGLHRGSFIPGSELNRKLI